LKKHLSTIIILFSLFALFSNAKTYQVNAADDLNKIISDALDGDVIVLASGVYHGNFDIDKSVTIDCQDHAELSGNNNKDTLRVKANDVTVKNCQISRWGDDLTEMNAGVFVEKNATNVRIENNDLRGDAFGILLDSANDASIVNNRIQGNLELRSQDRGNGIHLYNVTGALVENNEVWHTRDGIYIDTSNNNQLLNNQLHHLRFGVHYMYSYSNLVEGNYTHHTRTGYALMQSKYLTVINNRSENDSNYGILMNYIAHSTISGNQIRKVHQQIGPGGEQKVKGAEGKALFLYNAPFNQIDHNLLEHNEIGINLTAGSEDNKIYSNYFIGNKRQVKYVANREVEWSYKNRGNFWSDYQGWDSDGDGIGDEPFEPNDSVDKLLWQYPSANLLLNSPAIQSLRWAQKAFPVLKSPGIKDSFPLMNNNLSAKNIETRNDRAYGRKMPPTINTLE